MNPGPRFAFGANWARYVDGLDERRVDRAQACLADLVGTGSLSAKTFLDVGSGSGIHSLAAHRLGAAVHSFDYDRASVVCTRQVRDRFGGRWPVEQGDILDASYVAGLGPFDIVYSWGVLHHTGDVTTAVHHAAGAVSPGGLLVLALYNDAGRSTDRWTRVKRRYVEGSTVTRGVIEVLAGARIWGPTMARDALGGRPLATWRDYGDQRGMSPLVDLRDWVGGYPYEPTRPEQVIHQVQALGFALRFLRTVTGFGCNEYRFERTR